MKLSVWKGEELFTFRKSVVIIRGLKRYGPVVKVIVFTKNLRTSFQQCVKDNKNINKQIHGKNSDLSEIKQSIIYPHLHLQCHSVEKQEILSHWKNISWNQLLSNFFSKTVVFTKFLSKKCEREFPQFPHVWKLRKFSLFDKNFVKATVLLKKLINSWFHEKKIWWERISCFSTLWVTNYISWFHEIFVKIFREINFLYR